MQALLYCEQKDEAAVLTVILQQVGFTVRPVRNFDQAIEGWFDQTADLVLASIPGAAKRITELVRDLRPLTSAPIILVGDSLSNDQCIELLEAGADLIANRPYDVRLLTAQIRTLLRRTMGMPFFSLPVLEQAGVKLEPSNYTFTRVEGEAVRLTRLEFRLLFTLMTHTGQVIPTENLVELVWGYAGEGNRELVRGLVQRLRAKVEPDPHHPRYILTEGTIGYYFNHLAQDENT